MFNRLIARFPLSAATPFTNLNQLFYPSFSLQSIRRQLLLSRIMTLNLTVEFTINVQDLLVMCPAVHCLQPETRGSEWRSAD